MKKVLLTGMIGTLFAVSCSSANQAQNARADFMKLKGSWEISSVDYDKQCKIKPFDEGADAQCFVGSQWNLVPNNNTGSYALAGGGDCPTVTRAIKFDVSKDNFPTACLMIFKKLDNVTNNNSSSKNGGYSYSYTKKVKNAETAAGLRDRSGKLNSNLDPAKVQSMTE